MPQALPEIIAQVIGILLSVCVIGIVQLKSIKAILIAEVAVNLLTVANYALLGGMSGALPSVVAIFHVLLSYYFVGKERRFPLWLTAIFMAIYAAINVMTFRSPIDILPLVCTLLFAITVVQSKASGYRIIKTLTMVLWLVYDISVGAWTTVIAHGFLIVSGIIGIIRLDIKKAEK